MSNVGQSRVSNVYNQPGVLRRDEAVSTSHLLNQSRIISLNRLVGNKGQTNKVMRLPYDFRTTVLACATILSVYATGFAFAQTAAAKKSFSPLPNSIKDLENKTSKWGVFAATLCILSVVSAYFDAKRDHCRLHKSDENRLY